MSKKFRLKSKKIFNAIFKKADFVKSTSCVKLMFKKNNLKHVRVGIACSKKNNAVTRNKIKRIVREFMRINFPLVMEYDIIVYVNLVWKNRSDSDLIRDALSAITKKCGSVN